MGIVLGAVTPGCTLLELRTELQARGLHDIPDDRLDQFINDAHVEFNETHPWPWCYQEDTGPAPLDISNIGPVDYVLWDDTRLAKTDPEGLVARGYTDLTLTGVPEFWYFQDTDTIAVYPVTTEDITVRSQFAVPTLGSDVAQTVNPKRYCSVIVTLAQAFALGESKDNSEVGDRLESQAYRRIDRIAQRVLVDSVEGDFLQRTQDW